MVIYTRIRKSIVVNLILLSVLFTFIPSLLIAQKNYQDSGRDTTYFVDIEEVVITPNRFNSVPNNTPQAIKALGHKPILQHQVRTIPEALQLTPGVFVQKTNHGGGSPFLRGLTGNQILMLIDGIRLSNATMRYGPNQYLNTIDVFCIERMEVLRGSGSVQYGSDALGGAIQTFTHELITTEKPDFGGSVYSRISTHGMEQSLHSNLHYSSAKASFRAGLTFRNFGDIIGGDTTGRQSPTGYKEIDYDLKGKFILSTETELTLAYQSVTQNNVPVYHKIVLEDYITSRMDPQKRQLAYARLTRDLDAGIFKSFRITTSTQMTRETRESLKAGSSTFRTEKDRVRSLSLSTEIYTGVANAWTSTTGFEITSDLVKSTRIDKNITDNQAVTKRGLYPDGASMTSMAAFTIHTIDLPDWNFSAGARYNSFIISVEDEALGKTNLTPSTIVGNAGILRKLTPSSNLFVSIDKGFRAPNIDDMGTLGIVDFRYETPNFDLDPEHSLQYQLGYKYQSRKLRGELFLYRNELYNLIVRNRVEDQFIEGYPVYRKENIERAFIQGIETAWEFSPLPSWLVNGNVTYALGQNNTLDEPVRRIPPVFGGISVEYKLKGWWFNLGWQAAGKQTRLAEGDKSDNRIPEGGTPGWNIFNIDSGFTMRFVKFGLCLRNILNEDYRYHGSGINGYGRSALLSVAITF